MGFGQVEDQSCEACGKLGDDLAVVDAQNFADLQAIARLARAGLRDADGVNPEANGQLADAIPTLHPVFPHGAHQLTCLQREGVRLYPQFAKTSGGGGCYPIRRAACAADERQDDGSRDQA